MRRICRVLFSRYAISAVLILVEVVLFGLLIFSMPKSIYAFIAVSAVVAVLALVNLINKDTNPEYKISWAVVILTVPCFGALLYLLFYKRVISKREAKMLREVISKLMGEGDADEDFVTLSEDSALAAGKARALVLDYPIAGVYRSSQSSYISSGEEYFERLISDIEGAEKYIFLEYFIIDEGEVWSKIHGILKKKAEEGVDVRVLYDDIGCMKTLPARYELTLRREGIAAYRFARVNPRVSSVHHNRDHRKICVVDGRVAYTGGVNIADEYVNKITRFGHWKDGGIRIEGLAVAGFVKLFLSSYDVTAGVESDYAEMLSSVKAPDNSDGGYYIPFGSGPAPIYKRPVGKNVFLNIINQAERYVYITTPYLIIDYDLTEALRNAALRGVDVRIVTPGVADKRGVKVMTKSAYPYLLEAGVKIFEYTPGFIHEKLMVSDGIYAVIGTINLDFRSLVHHYECAVWMYRTSAVAEAYDGFIKTLESCTEIDREKAKLTPLEWMYRNGIRLFAPLL
ncbi:MAG: cardiolipin synthase [Clostridia bacterium]|nr:cardiolipin synthase [Clostridia bacterium]MBO5206181.1 cardiolipin synthase [Clostridia bacterium]